jgi:hypothetical protein
MRAIRAPDLPGVALRHSADGSPGCRHRSIARLTVPHKVALSFRPVYRTAEAVGSGWCPAGLTASNLTPGVALERYSGGDRRPEEARQAKWLKAARA